MKPWLSKHEWMCEKFAEIAAEINVDEIVNLQQMLLCEM